MYIWLKDGAEEELDALREKGRLGEIRVSEHSSSGRKHLAIYEDPFDPTADIPDIPEDLIDRVTLQTRIYRGFRTEGLYHDEDAVLMVKSHVRVHSELMADKVEREEWQDINISAPNVAALVAIYTKVRQGQLAPDENWEQA